MKISELARRTNTSKETIHHYIREGLLRRPLKTKENVANYTEGYVERLLIIKELREHYFLPLPEIKKVLKQLNKLSRSELFSLQIQNQYFKPVERLLASEVVGRGAFLEATGMGEKWLKKMEEWGVIAFKLRDGQSVYSSDDVIIGRLIVEMDLLGFGPKDGHDPESLRRTGDFIRGVLLAGQQDFLKINYGNAPSTETLGKGMRYEEVMSLFIYYLYRKLSREGYEHYLKSIKGGASDIAI
ncbi:MAG: MerR family transcriptional regulator [Thermodesulfobacteriota bacterium]|nr:MerR family transcriptional regulator [Thermodesulfobacteriota bacterium]